jgi:hypothetical protein
MDGWMENFMHGKGKDGLANGHPIKLKIKQQPPQVIEEMIAARLAKRIAK